MSADSASKAVVLTARVALALTIMLCAAGPWIFDSGQLTLLTEFFSVLVLVLVWNLLAGFADIVSVGQHAFVGVGAYAFYGLTVLAGINAFAAIPLAMLITLLLAIPCVAIVFRLRTAYLAVGTWVVAEVLMLTAGKLPGFGFGSGTSLPIPIVKEFGASAGARMTHFYIMAFVLALTAFGATWLLLRSRFGLGLTAMRDNEEAAGSAGVDLIFSRAACFLWTAPILGFVGVLVTLQKLRVAPTASFSITDWTIYIIFIAVIGGVGSLEGPIVGTIVFFLLREYLANFGTWYLILLGALSIAIVLVMPQGLWGLWRKHISVGLLPIGHATQDDAQRIG
jgi:branched-chain amino acid transport system permease protein